MTISACVPRAVFRVLTGNRPRMSVSRLDSLQRFICQASTLRRSHPACVKWVERMRPACRFPRPRGNCPRMSLSRLDSLQRTICQASTSCERQNAAGKGLFVPRHDPPWNRKVLRVPTIDRPRNARRLAASRGLKHSRAKGRRRDRSRASGTPPGEDRRARSESTHVSPPASVGVVQPKV